MRAGRLGRRLLMQQQTATQDALGGAVITWTTTVTVWGAVEALYGWEAFTADQVQSNLQVKIVIRYGAALSGLDTTWRVVDKNSSKKYGINSVVMPEQKSGNNASIELLCLEGKADDE